MTETKRDWPGLLVALTCIALGAWVIHEADSFSRFAAIFPRSVAMIMILASTIWILIAAFGPKHQRLPAPGTLGRPLGLITVGVLWAVLIPTLGFLPASIIGFIGAMLLAKFDPWPGRKWVKFLAIGVAVVVGGYALFKFALHVPL